MKGELTWLVAEICSLNLCDSQRCGRQVNTTTRPRSRATINPLINTILKGAC